MTLLNLNPPCPYLAAVMTAVRFVRKVDGETPTVYVELHKKEVLDRRTLKAEAESAIKDPAPDAIALNVLSTLIAYLTEDKAVGSIQRGKSAEKGGGGVGGNGEVKGLNGGDGTELPPHSVSVTGKELRVCVYHRGDVLEALSDCVVVLKRLPVLVAQQIVHTKLHCGQRERKDEFDGEIRYCLVLCHAPANSSLLFPSLTSICTSPVTPSFVVLRTVLFGSIRCHRLPGPQRCVCVCYLSTPSLDLSDLPFILYSTILHPEN